MFSKIFKPKEIFLSEETPFYDRRMVLVASEQKMVEMGDQIDWKKSLKTILIPGGAYFNFIENLGKGKFSYLISKKNLPALEINTARKKFKFPLQHPIDGVMYSSCDVQPDLYFPLAGFHDYFFESKVNALIELCSSLNAKEIKVIYAEEDNIDVTTKFKAKNIPTPKGLGNIGVDASYTSAQNSERGIFYSFGKPTKDIMEFQSPWLETEPSWITLQNVRLNGDAEHHIVNFSQTDEVGITADFAADLNKIGVNIGGTYNKLVKRKFKFQVEFWPKGIK